MEISSPNCQSLGERQKSVEDFPTFVSRTPCPHSTPSCPALFEDDQKKDEEKVHRTQDGIDEKMQRLEDFSLHLDPSHMHAAEDAEQSTEEGDLSSVTSSDSNQDEQIRCRICHSSAGVLYTPCACSGSIANVHQECLLQWLTVKNMRECEVCHTTYVFTPIYATDAPVYASFLDVVHWLVEKALTLYPKMQRCALVLASWLLIVPLLTAWIWRLCFVSSITDLIGVANVSQEQIWQSLQTGVIICFVVLMVTVIVATFRELMREEHHLAVGQNGGVEDGIFPGEEDLFDGDEPELDEMIDDVPLSTWIGFTGPIKFFFIHITSVILYNTVFLALAVFLPLQAGRIFFSAAHIDANVFARWVFDRVGDALQAGIVGEAYTPTPEQYEAMYELLPMKDASLLGCGYLSLMTLAMVWGPLSAVLNLNDLPFMGFICGLLRYVLTGFKFGSLVGFELGVFPVYLGWCLDLLVLDLVDSTWEARKRFFNDAPLTSIAMHWFLGINFILYVSFIASLLRRIIKRRILSRFLRYPDDPDFQPFHDFIYVPLYKHCKRLCFSGTLYTLLVVLCVHVPAKFFTRLFPNVAPLRWRFAERSEVPIDLLLFHFAIPAIMGHIDLRTVCLDGVRGWFTSISEVLGVDTYLLREDVLQDLEGDEGNPEEPLGANAVNNNQNNEQENEVVEQKVHRDEKPKSDCIPAEISAEWPEDVLRGDSSTQDGTEKNEEKELWPDEPLNMPDTDSTELKGLVADIVEQVASETASETKTLDEKNIIRETASETKKLDDKKIIHESKHSSAHARPESNPEIEVSPKEEHSKNPCSSDSDLNPEEKHEPVERDGPAPNQETKNEGSFAEAGVNRGVAAGSIPHFTLRIFLLILSSWMMHTLVLCACILVPVVLGRLLLRTVNAALARHDLYAVVVGLYAYLGGVIAGGRINAFLRRHDVMDGLALGVKWIFVGFRYIFLSIFVLGILPMLIGIFFDLTVMIPLRVPADESPRLFLERDWVLGVIFLKVWFQLLVSGIVGDNDVKDAVQQILNEGPENVSIYTTMKLAILPYLHKLLLCLLCPYALSRGVVPFLLRSSRHLVFSLADSDMDALADTVSKSFEALHPPLKLLEMDSTVFEVEVQCISHYVFRYIFVALVTIKASGILTGLVADWYAELKQSMFEERYLIGKRLHNFGETVTVDGAGTANNSRTTGAGEEKKSFEEKHSSLENKLESKILPDADETVERKHHTRIELKS
mmetsp:Transcript_19969/g.48903  ORF Transcript_19969/g.48903 Transcript_19969/m.48903 type:complete len:1235 (-) Transcript_19969:549-4253(-)|eukprot:CAMPEP_0114500794 /NCGR_PEP_ID=MMETSP0109-20121206/8153_1 /TAXON_ID=29199 /ORGANISM="Chlorarachnion reptans, Strain CCCM449" /LENGTH=1234 /DNA_ID=CAMNT_0001678477 /DNA_START=290 /DNA_END=3994 /DNA_ORIENTATION=-